MERRKPTSASAEKQKPSLLPQLSLPKGGGAIRGVSEKLTPNLATGSASLSVPIPASPGRGGFDLALSLKYDSNVGNGAFGLGWQLSVPTIARKTDKGIPRYVESEDAFVLSGAEDLVPVDDGTKERSLSGVAHRVRTYRPRVEGLFARIERWTRVGDGDVHWRVITRDNVTNVYGRDAGSRIFDPADALGARGAVFAWLLAETRDDRGNIVRYAYAAEDGAGVSAQRTSERHRFDDTSGSPRFTCTAQRYLKRIDYCNARPNDDGHFLFSVVLDYGEHDLTAARPDLPKDPWSVRADPFSTHRPGFEVRTYRLCRRVLMFHSIAELGPEPVLVRATELGHVVRDALSLLETVVQKGFVRANGAYEEAAFPPLTIAYEPFALGTAVRPFPAQSLEGIHASASTSGGAEWVDLNGEGLPGVLIAGEAAYYFKRNLGGGNLGPPVVERAIPAPGALHGRGTQLTDIDGDGQLDLVRYGAELGGFFARTIEADGGWAAFQTIPNLPRIDWSDPNLRFVDMDGDGFADVLVTEQDAFVVHRSRARGGFWPPERFTKPEDEARGPAILFANEHESLHLADMSGDGLPDIVRVRPGEVAYWPNLGYGRFGNKVVLDGVVAIATPDVFDPRRVHLVDIDGSGTADLVYVGPHGVDLYRNASGNELLAPLTIDTVPTHGLANIAFADVLGRGTSCLVWSSAGPGDAGTPLGYIDLVDSRKPHLVVSYQDGMGGETRVEYGTSTQHYLQDRREGRPWLTRLAFPVHVIDRVVHIDHVSRSTLTTRYRYHHGFYDGVERELGGFACVDQWDEEAFGNEAPPLPGAPTDPADVLRQPPTRTTTWFHTGAWLEQERMESRLALEYWAGDPAGPLLRDTPALPGTTLDEQREAARALRGSILRQELYAEDGSSRAQHPYSVSERSYGVRMVRAKGGEKHAIFFAHPHETMDAHYEREPADPRVQHEIVLSVDDFANVLESASIAYGRRNADPALPERFARPQTATTVLFVRHDLTLPIDDETRAVFRGPLPADSRSYELAGASRVGTYFTHDEIRNAIDASARIDFADRGAGAAITRRRIEHTRTIYRSEDLATPLSWRSASPRGIVHETYQLAFTAPLLEQVYRREVANGVFQPLDATLAAALTEGGHRTRGTLVTTSSFPSPDPVGDDVDADLWIPGGRALFDESASGEAAAAEASFFTPVRAVDPFGASSTVGYDGYFLLPTAAEDAVKNLVSVENDYRVLQPRRLTDPNKNRTEMVFDARGVAVATARMGKVTESLGDRVVSASGQPTFSTSPADVAAFLADPTPAAAAILLGEASERFVYDLSSAPTRVATIARDTHVSDLAPGRVATLHVTLSYFDGMGRAVQTKARAESTAPLPWIGSGWVVLDNKGKPVRQYEAFFTATHAFENARKEGVSATIFYDPLGRAIGTLHPNHTWEKVVFDAWGEEHWDTNDTCGLLATSDSHVGKRFDLLRPDEHLPLWPDHLVQGDRTTDEATAAVQAQVHTGTPGRVFLDARARPYLNVAHNRHLDDVTNLPVDELLPTFSELDIEGLLLSVVDAKRADTNKALTSILDDGRTVMVHAYDVAGRKLFEKCMDAGERWTLPDVAGVAIRSWDRMGRSFRMTFDAARRPLASFVKGHIGLSPAQEVLCELSLWGEGATDDEKRNLRGKLLAHHDGAGVARNEAFDFKGGATLTTRQFAQHFDEVLDWSTPGLVPMEADVWSTRITRDAFDRPVTMHAPDGSVVRPAYNERGLVRAVSVELASPPAGATPPGVESVTYDAKGQRQAIRYANGVETTYVYEKTTLRLLSLVAKRASGITLQRLLYTYDPVGNVTTLRDQAQPKLYLTDDLVSADASYVYGATYQLRRATGREHEGQMAAPDPRDTGRTGLAHPGDWTKMRNYTQSYSYDEVGNMLALVHEAKNGDYTRTFHHERTSRVEGSRHGNALTETRVVTSNANNVVPSPYTHDEHGNVVTMPHLPLMIWNHRDQLWKVSGQVVAAGDIPETTYYLYDAAGERVRKVTCAQGTTTKVEERLYLGGFEVLRKTTNAGPREETTLHLMVDSARVALIERESGTTLVRYQLDNHIESVSVEVDGTTDANIVSYEEYHPFGTTSFQSQNTRASKRYRFTSNERDRETGLQRHGRRYYAPWLCRWCSVDPGGLADGPNRWSYAQGNPVRLVDHGGTKAHKAKAKAKDSKPEIKVHEYDEQAKTFKVVVVNAPSDTDGSPKAYKLEGEGKHTGPGLDTYLNAWNFKLAKTRDPNNKKKKIAVTHTEGGHTGEVYDKNIFGAVTKDLAQERLTWGTFNVHPTHSTKAPKMVTGWMREKVEPIVVNGAIPGKLPAPYKGQSKTLPDGSYNPDLYPDAERIPFVVRSKEMIKAGVKDWDRAKVCNGTTCIDAFVQDYHGSTNGEVSKAVASQLCGGTCSGKEIAITISAGTSANGVPKSNGEALRILGLRTPSPTPIEGTEANGCLLQSCVPPPTPQAPGANLYTSPF